MQNILRHNMIRRYYRLCEVEMRLRRDPITRREVIDPDTVDIDWKR
jgi:hypothetical protein